MWTRFSLGKVHGALSKISQVEEDLSLFQQHKAKIYKQKVCLNVWKSQVSPLF